jgi:pimeloyl-ACP methyl ester carboxylesterase
VEPPETRYVKTPDGAHIAFQVFGSGPFELVYVPGFASNVEYMWHVEPFARGLRRLGSFARVVVFDRRGTGLSDRIDETNLPTLEARMDDIRSVMDAAEVARAALFGSEDGAHLCAMFAAAYPSRVFACVLHGTGARGLRAPDYPWAWSWEQWDEWLDAVDRQWGTQAMADRLAADAYPSHAADVSFRRELASFLRFSASPGAARVFESLLRDVDIREPTTTRSRATRTSSSIRSSGSSRPRAAPRWTTTVSSPPSCSRTSSRRPRRPLGWATGRGGS